MTTTEPTTWQEQFIAALQTKLIANISDNEEEGLDRNDMLDEIRDLRTIAEAANWCCNQAWDVESFILVLAQTVHPELTYDQLPTSWST